MNPCLGAIRWILHKNYHEQNASTPRPPKFRILKGLPTNFTPRERQLVMAALLHDLVDTSYHPSKLGISITITDPYVRWLCVHHHASKKYSANEDLFRLQEADSRMSRYARLLAIPTPRRKLAPVDTRQLADQLEQAAQRSIFQLYSMIYHSEELQQILAAKTHPMETLRQHLLRVANWVLFALRTSTPSSFFASVDLIGKPGGTPGPVKVEDPWNVNAPSASWGVLTGMSHRSGVRAVRGAV